MSITQEVHQSQQSLLREFRELRHFSGPPGEFWSRFLDCFGRFSGAGTILLMAREQDQPVWRRLATWPTNVGNRKKQASLFDRSEMVADQLLEDPVLIEPVVAGSSNPDFFLGMRLELDDSQPPGVIILVMEQSSHQRVSELEERLLLLVDIPASYQYSRILQQARSDVVQFADTIDLMTLLNESDRYMSTAMTFVNELAARYRCDRVSLGWLQGAYVRLQVISHMEKFERKMAAVQSLEAAMEEAFDQDEEIIWPVPEYSGAISRDHESYAQDQSVGHMVSMPVRVNGEAIAVLSCERNTEIFEEVEIRGLRLIVDQAARHLDQLKRHDRWFGARYWSGLRDKLSWFVGPEHTFAKALGVTISLLLAFVILGSWSYRVEAPFILNTDDVVFLPTPFDGYIEEVAVDIGDLVQEGDLLLQLDTQELILEEAIALADIVRYSRESEKARAQNALADMRIAEALVAQSQAQLEKVRYHIDNASIKAPFTGIVVEGDLERMLGASVRKGDILFKVADIDDIYAEINLPERDIHEVAVGRSGEIAFVSSPDEKFPIIVREVDPVAVTKEAGSVFVLRADVEGDPASWWRPGMSGIAKVDVGDRNILWIMTHRTVDFFRLLFWW